MILRTYENWGLLHCEMLVFVHRQSMSRVFVIFNIIYLYLLYSVIRLVLDWIKFIIFKSLWHTVKSDK